MESINEMKSWFFKKINKMYKPLARLRQKGLKVRYERGDVTTDIAEVH